MGGWVECFEVESWVGGVVIFEDGEEDFGYGREVGGWIFEFVSLVLCESNVELGMEVVLYGGMLGNGGWYVLGVLIS